MELDTNYVAWYTNFTPTRNIYSCPCITDVMSIVVRYGIVMVL